MKRIFGNHDGPPAIEYGLSAALLAVAAITALRGLGDLLQAAMQIILTGANAS